MKTEISVIYEKKELDAVEKAVSSIFSAYGFAPCENLRKFLDAKTLGFHRVKGFGDYEGRVEDMDGETKKATVSHGVTEEDFVFTVNMLARVAVSVAPFMSVFTGFYHALRHMTRPIFEAVKMCRREFDERFVKERKFGFQVIQEDNAHNVILIAEDDGFRVSTHELRDYTRDEVETWTRYAVNPDMVFWSDKISSLDEAFGEAEIILGNIHAASVRYDVGVDEIPLEDGTEEVTRWIAAKDYRGEIHIVCYECADLAAPMNEEIIAANLVDMCREAEESQKAYDNLRFINLTAAMMNGVLTPRFQFDDLSKARDSYDNGIKADFEGMKRDLDASGQSEPEPTVEWE